MQLEYHIMWCSWDITSCNAVGILHPVMKLEYHIMWSSSNITSSDAAVTSHHVMQLGYNIMWCSWDITSCDAAGILTCVIPGLPHYSNMCFSLSVQMSHSLLGEWVSSALSSIYTLYKPTTSSAYFRLVCDISTLQFYKELYNVKQSILPMIQTSPLNYTIYCYMIVCGMISTKSII